MKNLLLVFVFLLSCSQLFAQSGFQPIEEEEGFGGIKFTQYGYKLSPKQLVDIMDSDPDAQKIMKYAKKKSDISKALGIAGGALVAVPLVQAIAGGKANWILAGVGAGAMVAAIPFAKSYTGYTRIAVKTYNSHLIQATQNSTILNIGLNGNGVGMMLVF